MNEKLKEMRLVFFIKKHEAEINLLQKGFVDLFNECGKNYNDTSMQLGLLGGIIRMFFKNSNMPKEEVEKLLENIAKKFK